jgi:hypothetical protein
MDAQAARASGKEAVKSKDRDATIDAFRKLVRMLDKIGVGNEAETTPMNKLEALIMSA